VACRETDWRVLRTDEDVSAGFLGVLITLVGLVELGFDFMDFLAQFLETSSGVLSDDDEEDDDDDEADVEIDENEEVDELLEVDFVRLLRLALCCERVETLETLFSNSFGLDGFNFEPPDGWTFSSALPVLSRFSLVSI